MAMATNVHRLLLLVRTQLRAPTGVIINWVPLPSHRFNYCLGPRSTTNPPPLHILSTFPDPPNLPLPSKNPLLFISPRPPRPSFFARLRET